MHNLLDDPDLDRPSFTEIDPDDDGGDDVDEDTAEGDPCYLVAVVDSEDVAPEDGDEQVDNLTEDETRADDADLAAAEASSPAVMNERMVPLSSLRLEHKGWRNPRFQSGLSPEELRPLAESVARSTTYGSDNEDGTVIAGIQDRLLVVQVDHNGAEINVVLDGQRRALAMELAYLQGKKLGADGAGDDIMVPVADFEVGPVEWSPALVSRMLIRALETMSTRSNLSAFELSESAAMLRKMRDPDTKSEYTLAKIAATLGRSESWVSKILSAREAATPKLLHTWQTGRVTEEQFRELAKLPAKEQSKTVGAVAEARASGDKSGARATAKEQAIVASNAKAKEAKEPAKTKGKKPTVAGEQQTLPATPPKKPPPFAVVEDMLGMAQKRPPTHDYVKGIMDGIKWDRGMIDAADFGNPMRMYLQRTEDKEPVEKAAKKAARKK